MSFTLCVAVIPARATTVIPPAFDELVRQSDYIVHAVVKSVSCEWRTNGANRQIFTKGELDVKEVIVGKPPSPLVLEMLGGTMGDEQMVVHGSPQFKVGDEDILFVHGNGQYLSPLVAMAHGRYPLKQDKQTGRSYITRSNGETLRDEKDVSQPMMTTAAKPWKEQSVLAQPLSREAFIGKIKSSRQANPRPDRAN